MVFLTFVVHSLSRGKDERRESPFLDFCNTVIHPFSCMRQIDVSVISICICVLVAHPDVRKSRSLLLPQSTCIDIIWRLVLYLIQNLALLHWLLVETSWFDSYLHTMFRRSPSTSRNSWWLWILKSPTLHIIALTKKNFHKRKRPIVSQLQRISELLFVSGEVHFR